MENQIADWMRLCQELAIQSFYKGESPVGCIIIRGDQVIAQCTENSNTKNDISYHAEMEAIRLAVSQLNTKDLSECTLISTHEPCVMCSYAIRYYGVSNVIFDHRSLYFGGTQDQPAILNTERVPAYWYRAPKVICLEDY
jgi:tRNA(adenine34) deaminase